MLHLKSSKLQIVSKMYKGLYKISSTVLSVQLPSSVHHPLKSDGFSFIKSSTKIFPIGRSNRRTSRSCGNTSSGVQVLFQGSTNRKFFSRPTRSVEVFPALSGTAEARDLDVFDWKLVVVR